MLAAFTAGLTLITISELGDKTFFIAAILAMRHARRWVLIGVVLALAAMTLLSVALGQAVAQLPTTWVRIGEVLLFLGFGIKLLYDASQMTDQPPVDEQEAAMQTVAAAESESKTVPKQATQIIAKAFTLTFVAEWGDRTQIATVMLATAYQPLGVTIGAILGHTICAAIAVLCGRLIAGRISERTVTALGGSLFMLFGIVSLTKFM